MSDIKRFDSDGEFVLYKDHQAKIKELESQLAEAGSAAWYNFNNVEHITDFLLERDLLEVSASEEDELGAANNIINSFENVLNELAEAKKDQARYYWMQDWIESRVKGTKEFLRAKTRSDFDQAIDAAIASIQEGK